MGIKTFVGEIPENFELNHDHHPSDMGELSTEFHRHAQFIFTNECLQI